MTVYENTNISLSGSRLDELYIENMLKLIIRALHISLYVIADSLFTSTN